jgi:hypothetical protein
VAGFAEGYGGAVEVLDAVVEAVHGGLAALEAAGGEGAAATAGCLVGVFRVEGFCLCCLGLGVGGRGAFLFLPYKFRITG